MIHHLDPRLVRTDDNIHPIICLIIFLLIFLLLSYRILILSLYTPIHHIYTPYRSRRLSTLSLLDHYNSAVQKSGHVKRAVRSSP